MTLIQFFNLFSCVRGYKNEVSKLMYEMRPSCRFCVNVYPTESNRNKNIGDFTKLWYFSAHANDVWLSSRFFRAVISGNLVTDTYCYFFYRHLILWFLSSYRVNQQSIYKWRIIDYWSHRLKFCLQISIHIGFGGSL